MGSAVDSTNITRELQRYREAGLGGVHIIPIYGAKGFEDKFIEYLSARWMQMLRVTATEAERLDLGLDMTTGSGWCFGGPQVKDIEANASVSAKDFIPPDGQRLTNKFDRQRIQALVAFSTTGACVELTEKIDTVGTVDWTPTAGPWHVYAVDQRPSPQKVKRAGPGGQGHMLNLFYPEAVRNFLGWFDGAFAQDKDAKVRAMYHDSYEYKSDWSPVLFEQFERRRGYRLQSELRALFANQSSSARDKSLTPNEDQIARVKCDYRETISDIMVEDSLPLWTKWCRSKGFLTRNEAHGSPGNLLDLYALADIPETEMFHRDRNRLVSKFASSAAHVTGKNLVACETGTWLKEHFTETLADMKYLLDDLFLSGVNHIFYHGTCYSPDEAGWPGWHFYASYEMNPRNSIWRDVPALNAYAARCQSILQLGRPDNDLLLYWPIHDTWHNPSGMVQPFSVHARGWLEDQPIGRAAERLWGRGYSFDYISDRQLLAATAANGSAITAGRPYKAVIVPACTRMPLQTLDQLLKLADAGATVIFEKSLPSDVPGWSDLEKRRNQSKQQLQSIKLVSIGQSGVLEARRGQGRVIVGDLETALQAAGIGREKITDIPGLFCTRRTVNDGRYYFIANRGDRAVDGWVSIATSTKSATLLNPLDGRTGTAALRSAAQGATEVYLQLVPGASIILHTGTESNTPWKFWKPEGQSKEISGTWQLKFLEGGPTLPAERKVARLGSWAVAEDADAARFAGTARYSIAFDAPEQQTKGWLIDLGQVHQSARVRLNGRDLGTFFTPPFRIELETLKPKGNELEVEVTNVSANRIRDLDRRGVRWKSFYDINFVNIDYKPFDASGWPLYDSGLVGPVTLTPAAPLSSEQLKGAGAAAR